MQCAQTTIQIRNELKKRLKLTEQEATELFPDSNIPIWPHRLGWAITYLKKAGLITAVSRGEYIISEEGKKESKNKNVKITQNYLKKFECFTSFISKTNKAKANTSNAVDNSETPEDSIADAFNSLNKALIIDLKKYVSAMEPFAFERLVVDLLVAMGYGGFKKDTIAKVTKKTNDEGIDGIINQDKLGLDTIYLQAKRWQYDIGRKEIQSFVGALDGKHANKGIFITTSKFFNTAIEYAKHISKKVILIDGDTLAEYMIKYNVGVSTYATYSLKRIDSDYFDQNT